MGDPSPQLRPELGQKHLPALVCRCSREMLEAASETWILLKTFLQVPLGVRCSSKKKMHVLLLKLQGCVSPFNEEIGKVGGERLPLLGR